MMKLIGRTVFPLRLMALAAVLVLSSACCAHHRDVSMKKLSLTVNLDQGLQVSGVAPTMDVDLVGLTDQEHAKAAWTNLSMNDYWQSGNALRADTSSYRHTLKFGGKDTSFTVPSDNPIWEVWHQKGAKWLVVMAQLPGKHSDIEANSSERLDLPLEAYRWTGADITITVFGSQISVNPEPGPEQQDH